MQAAEIQAQMDRILGLMGAIGFRCAVTASPAAMAVRDEQMAALKKQYEELARSLPKSGQQYLDIDGRLGGVMPSRPEPRVKLNFCSADYDPFLSPED